MTSSPRGDVASATHPAEIQRVYERMLRAAGARERFLTRPDRHRVHVVAYGEGPPVVHLHGTNTSALSHLMLPGFSPGLGSFLVDRPGCGLSDAEEVGREVFRAHAVRFVGEVLDGLELPTAYLVGASGGGIWAMWFALAHPERVRGLVLLGSVPTLPGGRVPLPLRLVATPGLGELMLRVPRPGRRMLRRMMASVGEAETIERHPDLLDSLVAGARDPVAVRANVSELRALITPRGFRPEMRFTDDDLRGLDVPTLMIWGDRDPVVPVERARACATTVPDARLEVLPAGHVPQLGHPERVAALLEEFATR